MAVCVCIVSGKSHFILLSPSARAMNTISWSWTCWSTQLCPEIDDNISLAARFPLSRGDSLRDPNADPPNTHPVVVRHPILWEYRSIFSHEFLFFSGPKMSSTLTLSQSSCRVPFLDLLYSTRFELVCSVIAIESHLSLQLPFRRPT